MKKKEKIIVDKLIISDCHLGSPVSRAKELLKIILGFDFNTLILNGDIFESLNFERLDKYEWKILSLIRKMTNPKRGKKVVFVIGNHDKLLIILLKLMGIEVYEKYQWNNRGKTFYVIHGHQFDKFFKTVFGRFIYYISYAYYIFQKMDTKNQRLSRLIKRTSKTWLKVSEQVSEDALRFAEKREIDYIICGHTHIKMRLEKNGVTYINTGCWTDKPSTIVTISEDNIIKFHDFD